MDFAAAIKNEAKWAKTENGADALNTTGSALLNLFGTIGGLRDQSEDRIIGLVSDAYLEDPLLTTKMVFYSRDIRGGGLGERRVFRIALRWLAIYHPEAVIPNLHLIAEYGRWDNIYTLVDTPCEKSMWLMVSRQLNHDLVNKNKGLPISLLAKWLKSVDTSSKESRMLGKLTAINLDMTEKRYRKILSSLRAYLKVVEKTMCANEWDKIRYETVPSRAAMIYAGAFGKHDNERYKEYLAAVRSGDTKINAGTLYPYDLVRKAFVGQDAETVNALWDALPNYVEPGSNVVVMADTSGSMNWHGNGRPLHTSLGLAVYFAERNTGAYHNMFMTFDYKPEWRVLKGEQFTTKVRTLGQINPRNTDLEAAFNLVLDTATKNHVSPEEMPKAIIVISDMEIDEAQGGGDRTTFTEAARKKFAAAGYELPKLIYWNVDSRNDTFHADATTPGVILCSGQSASVFKGLLSSINNTPMEYMLNTLNSVRYMPVTVG